MLAAIGGVLFLSDVLSTGEWGAIAIVVIGLVSLVRPGVSTVALAWAALTALTIGVYTTLDIDGACRSTGIGYGITLVFAIAITVSVAAGRGQGEGHRSTQEAVGHLHEDAGAVTGVGIGAGGATVFEVDEQVEGRRDDGVRAVALDVGDEADAAGVVLVGGAVQAPPLRQVGATVPGWGVTWLRWSPWSSSDECLDIANLHSGPN